MMETKADTPATRACGRRSNFSISGKEISTCGLPVRRARFDQGGQAVQGLRAEYHIDVRRARHDGGAFLAGDTAAYAYEQAGARPLQVFHPAQVVEHFLLRLSRPSRC